MLVPAGVQLIWLTNKLYEAAMEFKAGRLTPRRLRFDFAKMAPLAQKIYIELNERQLQSAFDRYDQDKDGFFSKVDTRSFVDEVFKFKGDG